MGWRESSQEDLARRSAYGDEDSDLRLRPNQDFKKDFVSWLKFLLATVYTGLERARSFDF